MCTNINTSNELLSAGRWTQFLESLPLGITDWMLDNYKDLLKIRVTASMLTTGERSKRAYSVKVSKDNDLKVYIEVSGKKNKTTFQDKEL